MHRIGGFLLVLLLAPLGASAQTPSSDNQEQEIREMRARIEKLEKLVEELQKERAANSVAPHARAALRAHRPG